MIKNVSLLIKTTVKIAPKGFENIISLEVLIEYLVF